MFQLREVRQTHRQDVWPGTSQMLYLWEEAPDGSSWSRETGRIFVRMYSNLWWKWRSSFRIVLLKVFHRSDPSRETLTYAVLDDQSTDVFVSDSILDYLGVEGQEVNLQVNTIVGTNTIRTKKATDLCIQDIHSEHSPNKVPFAYARDSIPATHCDIATLSRQW
jgi:hypothetical protein